MYGMKAGGGQIRIAFEKPLQHGSLGCARHEEGDFAAAFERWVGQRYARLGLDADDGTDPAGALVEDTGAREQRGDVSFGAKAEEGNVEQRPVGAQRRGAIEAHELPLVGEGRVLGCEIFGRYWMNIGRRYGGAQKHSLPYHAIVALRAVVRDEPLIAPEPLGARPWEGLAIGRAGQQLIEPARGRTTRQSHGKRFLAGTRRRNQPFGNMAGQ